MVRIILKLIVLLCLAVVSCMAVFVFPIKYKHGLSLIIDKRNMLEKSSSPKIVLIGGSNLLIGVDSSLISRSFGYNVINMGHYGGFGISIILKDIQKYLKNDDIVIISPEYRLLIDDFKFEPFNEVGVKGMLAYSPVQVIKDVYRKRYLKGLLTHFAELVSEKTQTLIDCLLRGTISSCIGYGKINSHDDINEFGDSKKDVFDKLQFTRFPDNAHVFQNIITDLSKFTVLNNFNENAVKNNARVFFMFPPYPTEAYELNKNQFNNINCQLVKNLNFKILGTPEDFIYDSVFFSNTCNHLTSAGKKIRTQKIIELLTPYLKRQVS